MKSINVTKRIPIKINPNKNSLYKLYCIIPGITYTVYYSKSYSVLHSVLRKWSLESQSSKKASSQGSSGAGGGGGGGSGSNQNQSKKTNRREFSLKAMANEFNKILDEVLKSVPQPVSLNLPKLKKVSGNKSEPAKIKLPKLKKVTWWKILY